MTKQTNSYLQASKFKSILEAARNQDSILIDGIEYHLERTPRADLRFFDVKCYSFLEQNPRKSSHWAKLARGGSLIMWVMKGRRYLGQVRNGVFYDLRKRKD
jgi:hypothetical protein